MARSKSPKIVSNVKVGKAQVKPTAPGHVRGVFQGNHPHFTQRHKGIHEEDDGYALGSARRSTGIRPKNHEAIDPRMPKLSPA